MNNIIVKLLNEERTRMLRPICERHTDMYGIWYMN